MMERLLVKRERSQRYKTQSLRYIRTDILSSRMAIIRTTIAQKP
jgi:hypothetical protein